MKQLFISFALFILFATNLYAQPQNNYRLSELDAIDVVRKQMSCRTVSKDESQERQEFQNRIKSVENVSIGNETDSCCGLYIINFKDDAGFVVASADCRDETAIYISSSTGNITSDKFCDYYNGFGVLKSLITDYQKYQIEQYYISPKDSEKQNNPSRSFDYYTVTTIDTLQRVGPLMDTQWHQDYPFNRYQPNLYPMGCAPVAMGQIMNYYQHPESVIVDNTHYNFNWTYLSAVHNHQDAIFSIVGTAEVFELLYSIGLQGNATYAQGGTTFPRNNIASTFNHYQYMCSRDDFDYGTVKSNVVNYYRPVLVVGTDASCSYYDEPVAHAWVVDGFLKTRTTKQDYNEATGLPLEDEINEVHCRIYDKEFVYVNWGWGDDDSLQLYSEKPTIGGVGMPLEINANLFMHGALNFNTQLEMWYNIYPY